MAFIIVSSEYDLGYIANQAGQMDEEKRYYREGKLYVEEVSQESLDNALSSYSNEDMLVIQQALQITAKQKQLIEDYGWKITRYDREDKLVVKGKKANTTNTENQMIQVCEWCDAISLTDELQQTFDQKMIVLQAYEGWFPYTDQPTYDADAFGFRT